MSGGDKDRDLKKLLGSAKITFILGGPASGKGTQCEKLVEEFGYTHISTGDLMRAEIAKGTKEGDRIKKIVADGGLVPFETTVHLLTNALIATQSKNYLIDGFPRAVDQAQFFEQQVVETQQVLFYDVPQELMIERCMKRAETSGRDDDNAETIKKRIQQFFDQSLPVVEYYKRFGKVRKIDATGGISDVYAQSKDAVLPQTMFVIGPKGSGKTTIARNLSERTNAAFINFLDFKKANGLQEADDEESVLQLIQTLAGELKPRVVLENFPQNLLQAKFFLRNCKAPSNVFNLNCSKDICQERMSQLGENHPNYVSSAKLSKKIKEFNNCARDLVPCLQAESNYTEVDTNQSFDKTMDCVNKRVEPCVIHIRPGANSNDLRKEITDKLSKQHNYMNLDINALIRDENERKTSIGLEMNSMVQANKIIPAEMIVRMLKKIIYSGNPLLNKFILTSFPDIIEQAKEFETNCAKISAIIYSTTQDRIVEIKNNNLSLFNIDSLFQKEFRLRTMDCWDFDLFNDKMGNMVEYGLVLGRPFSGKTHITNQLVNQQGFCAIDMKAITDAIKVKLTPEDGEFEGEVPIADIEKQICQTIEKSRNGQSRQKFIFDGYTHATVEAFLEFISQFGQPQFVLNLTATDKNLKQRWSKKNDDADFPEEGDVVDEFITKGDADVQNRSKINLAYAGKSGRVDIINLDTSGSIDTLNKGLKTQFSPKVIIVNHEKRLGVDVTCANLAIKFNLLYISVYQLIRQHIEGNTVWGKKLMSTKRHKEISLTTQVRDEFNEAEFSAVHYNQKLVMELINYTIAENRTNQKYIILEGVCNSMKLTNDADKFELRLQDEINDIEQNIGEIQSMIGLQFSYEPEFIDNENIEYEKFPETEEKVEVKKAEGEEGEEAAAEEAKKETFKPEHYVWTVTNNKAVNLPQCFINSKSKAKADFGVKQASLFSSSQYEAIYLSLDEFVQHTIKAHNDEGKYVYRQVIFDE